MKVYKIPIRLESALITPLKGDTIWGHIVWGIVNHEGEAAVHSFLEESKKEPPLVVSSAFPRGFLCKHIREPPERKEDFSADTYAEIKRYKRQKYEEAAQYITAKPVSDSSDFSRQDVFKEVTVMHNTINRFSSTVLEDGGLYSCREKWPKQKDFDLYAVSSYPAERIRELFVWAFENGFGADASSGKGNISVFDAIEEVEWRIPGKKYMALGPFVLPRSKTAVNLRADIFVRTGKVGGAFVSELSPYKKTAVLYDEGAVFECSESILYIGELLCDVHSDKRICQSGFAPVVPIGE